MDYEEWNKRLVDHFFHQERDQTVVRLYITPAEIEALVPHAGLDDFIQAIRAGPNHLGGKGGPCNRAYRLWKEWDHESPPPFLAYLVCFVAAWTLEATNLGKINYYGRLYQFLELQNSRSGFPSFERMAPLWLDVAAWANDHHEGSLGVFQPTTNKNWVHVGYPEAQAIFSGAQRAELHRAFARNHLSPYQSYPRNQLLRIATTDGKRALSDRQFKAVAGPQSDEQDKLIAAIRHELSEWTTENKATAARPFHPLLRIDYFPGSQRINAHLHIQTQREIPEDGLDVTDDDGNQAFFELDDATLTGPLLDARGAPILLRPEELEAPRGWYILPGPESIHLPPAKVRCFALASQDEPTRFHEVASPPTRGRFLLIGESDSLNQEVARQEIPVVLPLSIKFGLPENWLAMEVPSVNPGKVGSQVRTQIRLNGGIRATAGNTFFDFAPPILTLLGEDDCSMRVNEILKPNWNPHVLRDQTHGRYVIQAETDEGALAKRTIHLVKPRTTIPVATLSEPRIQPTLQPTWEAHWPTGSHILLGALPGQIADLRHDTHPVTWQPAWLIVRGRPPTAIQLDAINHLTVKPWKTTPHQVRAWRKQIQGLHRKATIQDAEFSRPHWEDLCKRALDAT